MADWEGLHSDILVEIGKKIKLIQDFVAFSLVCKSWRDAAGEEGRHPPIPLLILPEKKADNENHQRHIYSVSKGSILTRNLYIPEMSGNKRCIGLNYGWVLTISEEGDMNLVHPLSRTQIKLPPQTSIVDYGKHQCAPPQIFTRKAALSGNPSESDDFVVMIIHSGSQYLGYWRAGDKSWTRIGKRLWWTDLIYYDNQFYAITNRGLVWSCKVHELTIVRVVTQISSRLIPSGDVPYIVGLAAGVLLLVVREEKEEYFEDSNEMSEYGWNWGVVNYWVSGFQVYELDLMKGSHNLIKSLGDRAVFVGLNTSVLLDLHASEYPGIKPNNIYFTDDRDETYSCIKEGGGKDMGSYNLEDGQITPFKVEESLSRINTPFWFIPSL